MTRAMRLRCLAVALGLWRVGFAAQMDAAPGPIVARAVTQWGRWLDGHPRPLDLAFEGEVKLGKEQRGIRLRVRSDGKGKAGVDLRVGKTRVRAFTDETRSLLCVDRREVVFEGRGPAQEARGCPVARMVRQVREGLPPAARVMAQSPEQLGALVGLLAMEHVAVAGQEVIDGTRCLHLEANASAGIGSADIWLSDSAPVRLSWRSEDGLSEAKLRLRTAGLEPIPAVPNGFEVVTVPRDELDRTLVHGVARAVLVLLGRVLPRVPAAAACDADSGRLLTVAGKRVAMLRGTHRQMGLQHGRLLRPHVRAVMETVLYTVGFYTSIDSGQWFLDVLREARRRTWPFTPECYKEEMAGLAEGSGLPRERVETANVFPEYFHCSGFALWGKATKDGALYHGRVLDYMRHLGFQDHAAVFVCKPDSGYAFVNVGYAGFVGSVTGMNERQVAVGEMGGGRVGDWDGLSMPLLVRHVLERAGTLAEALSIFRGTPRTCEYFYVVSDGKIPDARGLWTTREKLELIEPNKPHPRLPIPIEDGVLMSSGRRYKALGAKVRAAHGQIDAARARALVDREVAIVGGNLHNVLFAPQTLELWVQDASSRRPALEMPYARLSFAELLRMADSH